jgi:hypothetical protein
MFRYLERALPTHSVQAFEVLEEVLQVTSDRIATAQEGRGTWPVQFSEVPLKIVTFVLETRPDLETQALTALDQLTAALWAGANQYLQDVIAL